MGSDPRSSAAPLYSFRIASAELFFHLCQLSPFAVPPAPKHWINKQIWWFWVPFRIFRFRFFPFSFFSVFSVFSVFLRSVFSVFSGVSNFRIFRFWGGRVSEETVPKDSVCFPALLSPPKPKATHPKQRNAMENATMQVTCCCWLSPSFPSMPTQVCCASARSHRMQRPQDGGAESNTACRTNMDGNERVSIWYAHTQT